MLAHRLCVVAYFLVVSHGSVRGAEPPSIVVEMAVNRTVSGIRAAAYIKNTGDAPVSVITAMTQYKASLRNTKDNKVQTEPDAKFRLHDFLAAKRVVEGELRAVANLSLAEVETDGGDPVIPPLESFKIIALRKGQKARLDPRVIQTLARDVGEAIESREPEQQGNMQFVLGYTVSKFWGEQLGVWHGSIETKVVVSSK